jgi:hypothetical protein
MLNRELIRNGRISKGQNFWANGKQYRVIEAHYYTQGGEWALEDSYYLFKAVNDPKIYKMPALEIEERIKKGIIKFTNGENKKRSFRRTPKYRK